MHPVLISLGSFSVSSFGFFLSLAFLVAVYVIWRLCRVYDINEEKILDIALLTFFGSLLGARLYFVVTNLALFDSVTKILLINKFPGLYFWGGVIGGLLSLIGLTRKFKMDFWHIADFVMVGFFAALTIGSLGCLLGSCQSGAVSNSIIAVEQIGLEGKRFPIQFFEAVVFFWGFLKLWKAGLRFHYNGKIVSSGLFLLGLTKFIAGFFRSDNIGRVFALVCILSSFAVFYRQTKRSVRQDAGGVFSKKFWRMAIPKISRGWYNLRTNFKISLNRSRRTFQGRSKNLLKSINVKSQPPKY